MNTLLLRTKGWFASHRRLHVVILLGFLSSIASTTGCRLLQQTQQTLGLRARSLLPDIPTSPDAMEVEIVFVERLVGDPLLGPQLWEEVDQIGSFDANVRQTLRDNGFRVGLVGSTPPRALQQLLRLQDDLTNSVDIKSRGELVGRRIVLRSGAETEIQTSPVQSNCTVAIHDTNGTTTKAFTKVVCKFRVTAERVQDGWAKLVFLPELHHGNVQVRPTAAAQGFQFRTAQIVEPLYSQQFALTLNVGEMAVISTDIENGRTTETGEDESRLTGHYFFHRTDAPAETQGLLVVRLANMSKTDQIYSE